MYLEHFFFKDFSKPLMYKSIRPGSKKGDAKVSDIRCLKYSNDGKIHYKLSFKDGSNYCQRIVTAQKKSMDMLGNLKEKPKNTINIQPIGSTKLKNYMMQVFDHSTMLN